jgi:acyl-CoA reductase-like NAD-dependent aldehyde dehydrogenase
MALAAQAGYYSLYWFLGDRAHREHAAEGFERVLVSGVLFGVALILINLSLWGLNTYLSVAGVRLPDNSAIQVLNQTKSWQDFGVNVQAALSVAEQTYKSYAKASGTILAAYSAAVVSTGVTHWTSPISMAILNVLAFLVTAATTVLLSSAVYAVAMVLARSWPALLPLGAVLVTYERTRHLGAWLLAVSVVAPIVLTAGADVLRSAVDPIQIAALAGMVTPLFVFFNADPLLKAMIILGLIGLTLGVLSYAASRLFDHAGASLSLE